MNPVLVVVVLGLAAWPYRRLRCAAGVRAVDRAPCNVRPRRARPTQVASTLPDAIELVVLAVRAGALPSTAVSSVVPHLPASIAPAFEAVHLALLDGTRFSEAVQLLPQRLGPAAIPLADSLAAADHDGLPLAPVLERLAAEARMQRRRHADTLARQLPVRLSLPLVLCTLPSFVLLAVAPLLLAALSSLHR
jgi:tight adherence protein C